MKIIAGKYKNHFIKTYSQATYRPTSARVRKSIFDILQNLQGARVLDLFAGSGMLGFEAASRGAKEITFVEIDQHAIQFIKRNTALLMDTHFSIFKKNVFTYLQFSGEYDYIFADPPYEKIDLEDLIAICRQRITSQGLFILESSRRDKLPSGMFRKKMYGDTVISFWESNK